MVFLPLRRRFCYFCQKKPKETQKHFRQPFRPSKAAVTPCRGLFCLRQSLSTPVRFRRAAASTFPLSAIYRSVSRSCLLPTKGNLPSEALRHASSVQIFQPCLLSFFLGWCGLIFHIQLMPHHGIQLFLQTSPDVLCIIILPDKVIMQKFHRQVIGDLRIFHFLSLPFRDGRDDGDGVLHTIKITVTTDTIVTLFPKQVSA